MNIYIRYDSASEQEPTAYTHAVTDAVVGMLTGAGITADQINRSSDGVINVSGIPSDNDFASLKSIKAAVLARYPLTTFDIHYSYTLTPEAKNASLLKAIDNAHAQAEALATSQGRRIIHFRTTTCQIAIIDASQSFNPSQCADVPEKYSVTDTDPKKLVVVSVDGQTFFNF